MMFLNFGHYFGDGYGQQQQHHNNFHRGRRGYGFSRRGTGREGATTGGNYNRNVPPYMLAPHQFRRYRADPNVSTDEKNHAMQQRRNQK